MNQPDEKKQHDPQLRAAAETQLAKTAMAATPARPVEDLLHDLHVHQIELDMQNEALRQANIALEDSRDRYADLYEFAPVGYLTLTSDGLIAEINLTGARLLGLERKNLLHRRFTSFVIPEDQDRWTRHYLSVKRDGGQGSAELALQRGDGTVFHVQLDCLHQEIGAGNATIRPEGSALGVRVVLSDITARKQAEEARQTSEARLSGLVSSVLDAIIAIDSNHCITLFNPAAEDMFGLTSGEVLGSNLDRLIPSRFRSTHSDQIYRFGETKFSKRLMGSPGEIFGLHADGSEFPIDASISQLEVNGEKMFTVMLRDITERKRAEDAVLKTGALQSAIFNSANFSSIATDAKGVIQIFNVGAERMLGYVAADVLNKITPADISDQIGRASCRERV